MGLCDALFHCDTSRSVSMAQNDKDGFTFDPKTGKLRLSKKQTIYDNVECVALAADGFFAGYGGYDSSQMQMLFSTRPFDPSKTIGVETIHISCKSDTFKGKNHNYAGVMIYHCNGKSDWKTANRTHCKSGYLVIQDTDSEDVKKWRGKTDGVVHGAVYRNAFGEDKTSKVIGEGFAIQGGLFKVNSGAFNKPGDEYHDSRKQMSEISIYCIEKVVESWKKAGPKRLECRNFPVKDLLKDYTAQLDNDKRVKQL